MTSPRPDRVAFVGRATSTQNLATAQAWYPVTLDGEEAGGSRPPSQPKTRFVSPRDGVYRCGGSALFLGGQATTAGTTSRAVRLIKSGADVPGSYAYGGYSGTGLTVSTPTLFVLMFEGDYLELHAQSSLANSTLAASTLIGSVLTVEEMGR